MVAIFSLYKNILNSSYNFALISTIMTGVIISSGKELLDKKITLDDIVMSVVGIILGSIALLFFKI